MSDVTGIRLNQLTIALNAESFDDFPVHLTGTTAHSVLHCWTALWHPALVAAASSRPTIVHHHHDVGDSDRDDKTFGTPDNAASENGRSRRLIVVPEFLQNKLDSSWQQQAEFAGCILVNGSGSRLAISKALLTASQLPDGQSTETESSQPDLADELVQDFFALGYAWLQVRLMTLHVRYSTNLDEHQFDKTLVTAAGHWLKNNFAAAKEYLQIAFDLLLEEKNRYYPVQPDLIELVLVERSTLGESVDRQLEHQNKAGRQTNWLLTSELAEQLANDNPNAFAVLKKQISEGQTAIVGGISSELPVNLTPLETQRRLFQTGRETLQQLLDTTPKVFLRRRFGLTPATPDLLEAFDFHGAFHFTLDGGQFPAGSSSVLRWESPGGQSVPAIAAPPLDGSDEATFLDFGIRIARALDAEHLATLVLAHWPGHESVFLTDLQRIAWYGPLLGTFKNAADWFANTYDPGFGESFTADEYKSPLLKQLLAAGTVNPVSRFVDYWRLSLQLFQVRSRIVFAASREMLVQGSVSNHKQQFDNELDSLTDQLQAIIHPYNETVCHRKLTETITEKIDRLAAKIDNALPDDAETSNHVCVENTHWFSVATLVSIESKPAAASVPELGSAQHNDQLPLAATTEAGCDIVVRLPATGSLTVNVAPSAKKFNRTFGPPVDDELMLRNEHFQISTDPISGGIRSWQTYRDKTTHASQRLSIRLPATAGDPDRPTRYAAMVATEVKPIRLSDIRSQIVSTGQLVDPADDAPLANFAQRVTVQRMDRTAHIEIELEPLREMTASQNHYFCSRLAWQEDTATLSHGASEVRATVQSEWIDAPTYIRVEQSKHNLTLLTGGLPWHRRSSRKILDSILIIGNETCRNFQIGIADQSVYDLRTALAWMSQPHVSSGNSSRRLRSHEPTESQDKSPGPTSDWLYHISSKNLVVLASDVLWNQSGTFAGIKLGLLETEGRRGKLKLTCPFQVRRADRVSLSGKVVGELEHENTIVRADFARNEYFQMHVHFHTTSAQPS